MAYDYSIDEDFAVLSCDFPNCDFQEGYEGTDLMCRRMAKEKGWRFVNSIDGVSTLCPNCKDES